MGECMHESVLHRVRLGTLVACAPEARTTPSARAAAPLQGARADRGIQTVRRSLHAAARRRETHQEGRAQGLGLERFRLTTAGDTRLP
eukprot:6203336-Pleurochrysis_carterae.AAC.3